MSEKKKAAAVLHIRPSDAAIEWLKSEAEPWRGWAEEELTRHLESLARGDHYARIRAEELEGIGAHDVASILAGAEMAGEETARQLRAEKRQKALLTSYTKEELQAALAAAGKASDPLLLTSRPICGEMVGAAVCCLPPGHSEPHEFDTEAGSARVLGTCEADEPKAGAAKGEA